MLVIVKEVILGSIAGVIFGICLIGNCNILQDDISFNENKYSTKYSINEAKIFVINLDKCIDRWNRLNPLLKDLGIEYERISGVLGAALSEEEKQKLVDHDQYNNFMSIKADNGTIGCYMSHVKVWTEFLKSGYKYAIVMEDDVNFNPGELKSVIDDLKGKDRNWDIVSLNLAHDGWPVAVENIGETGKQLVKYRRRVSLTGCYMISRSGAIKLLKKALPIKMPVDYYFVRSWELGTVFYGVEPRMVFQVDPESEIVAQKSKVNRNPLPQLVVGIVNQLKTDIMTFVHSFR